MASRDGTFAADAPEIAAKFDDGGRRVIVGFAGIEDERDAVPELGEDLGTARASGRTRNIGAGAGERDAEFGNEIGHDRAIGPAKSDATRVGGDFEGKAVGGVDNHGERTGPAGVGEAIKVVGKIAGENGGVDERVDEDGEGAAFGTSLNAENFFDGREINGIGGESVERVCRNGDNRASIQPTGGVADDTVIRIGGINSQYLGRQ